MIWKCEYLRSNLFSLYLFKFLFSQLIQETSEMVALQFIPTASALNSPYKSENLLN